MSQVGPQSIHIDEARGRDHDLQVKAGLAESDPMEETCSAIEALLG